MNLPLSQGRFALIDEVDAALVADFKWSLSSHGYAVRRDRLSGTVYLHRVLMAPPAGLEVDHINGDKLDNRRANLRLATHAQNGRNSRPHHDRKSQFKGVYSSRGKWRANIFVEGRQRYLGTFPSEVEAARAYEKAARAAFGEFSRA